MTARTHAVSNTAPIDDPGFQMSVYFEASSRAVRGPARETEDFSDAMEALHLLATQAVTEPLRIAARRTLALARHRLRADYGHPHHSEDRAIVPGRGVWVERRTRRGTLQTMPATVLEIVKDLHGERALLQLEADDHVRFWTPVCLLTARAAAVAHLPLRTASPATHAITEASA